MERGQHETSVFGRIESCKILWSCLRLRWNCNNVYCYIVDFMSTVHAMNVFQFLVM